MSSTNVVWHHASRSHAGGAVLTLDGTPLDYAQTTQVLNPHFVVAGAVG